jgi:hypothetical protein
VVDGGGLENHCTRKGTGGSNPSLSVSLLRAIPTKQQSIERLQVPVERPGAGRTQAAVDTTDQRVGKPRFRESEIAKGLPGFVRPLDFELRGIENPLEGVGDLELQMVTDLLGNGDLTFGRERRFRHV